MVPCSIRRAQMGDLLFLTQTNPNLSKYHKYNCARWYVWALVFEEAAHRIFDGVTWTSASQYDWVEHKAFTMPHLQLYEMAFGKTASDFLACLACLACRLPCFRKSVRTQGSIFKSPKRSSRRWYPV